MPKNRPMPELYECLIDGDQMTDSEWIALLDQFGQLKLLLMPMGKRMAMVRNEVITRYDRILDVCRARGLTDL